MVGPILPVIYDFLKSQTWKTNFNAFLFQFKLFVLNKLLIIIKLINIAEVFKNKCEIKKLNFENSYWIETFQCSMCPIWKFNFLI